MRRSLLTCGVSILALLTLALYFAIAGVKTTEAVGGSWELVGREYLAGSHRSSPNGLFHRVKNRAILVDEYVSNARYYGDDCVVYETLRTINKQYFAVCGDRKPALVATEDGDVAGPTPVPVDGGLAHAGQGWTLEAEGLRRLEWIQKGDQYFLRPTTLIGVAEIKRRAITQALRPR